MEKYIYCPVKFYLITFACTWFWWLFAILFNEGTSLYLGMFLGLISPACVVQFDILSGRLSRIKRPARDRISGRQMTH